MIDAIENLPEVSFIGNTTLDQVKGNMRVFYKEAYYNKKGINPSLSTGDPIALILDACAVQLYQVLLYADRAGKMNLLKYAYGPYLDNLGALKGLTRKPATPAVVTMRFMLEDELEFIVPIPAGTRVKAGTLFFATDDYAEIPIGDTYIDVTCTCQTPGEEGNGFAVGDITGLADSVAYISSVVNTDESSGGTDEEEDEDFIERIYYAPSGYSTAGPSDAYISKVSEYSPAIGSVVVTSPSACVVNVYILMADGSLPTLAILSEVEDYLSADDIRPLTDQVNVLAPSTVTFNIDVTYYINTSDSAQATTIQQDIETAIDEYIEWQTGNIGTDINPSELNRAIIDAGAKRCVINYPGFTPLTKTEVARLGTKTVTYGGLEDD